MNNKKYDASFYDEFGELKTPSGTDRTALDKLFLDLMNKGFEVWLNNDFVIASKNKKQIILKPIYDEDKYIYGYMKMRV